LIFGLRSSPSSALPPTLRFGGRSRAPSPTEVAGEG
jgi:hypothetical protein